MEKKNTGELDRDIMAAPDLERFLQENEKEFVDPCVPDLLDEYLKKKGINKTTLAKQSGMSDVFLYQVFSGRRNPSRNRLLCLCFGLCATLDETQDMLKKCGYAQLYAKNRRDAIMIYSLSHGVDLFETNDRLFAENEETLL